MGTNPREVFVESLQKWFDVRARYLQWTDGRLAQMLIATDITPACGPRSRRRTGREGAGHEPPGDDGRDGQLGGARAEPAADGHHQLLQRHGVARAGRHPSNATTWSPRCRRRRARPSAPGQIIHRIRAFVKRSEPQRQPAQARQIVEDAVELAGIELRRRNVAIHTYVAQRLPEMLVDPILIEQVVLNLLKNAAEAIDSAGLPPARRHIELRVVPRHTPEEGGVIEFSVTDMGPGLKEEVIARLYEAFFSTKAEGLGIGLSLCRTIVESHRGRMRAQNLYNGSASSAVVSRSLCRSNIAARPEAPAPTPSRAAETGSPPSPRTHGHPSMSLIPKKGTVYVVDDDEAVRDSLQWLLEGKDYRVKCFDSAESFLSRFDPREVACLIADIRMEGMSGLELQDRLIERRSPLPVVFITGHGDVPMAVSTMKKGAMDFIEKPFKEEELLSLVERMLDQARSAFSQHQEQASRDALLSRLTTREAQVLERIVAGRLNKQIADDLGISIKTVEAHRANIMEKLNANTVADLLKIALGAQPKA
jgi:FixJ family two-component response regulator